MQDKITKYGWIILISVSLLMALLSYFKILPTTKEIPIEQNDHEAYMEQIINNPTCPVEGIDWNVAVRAFTKHFDDLRKQNPKAEIDLGPAEIERHFEYNCEEDLKIYNDYLVTEIDGVANLDKYPEDQKFIKQVVSLMENKKLQEAINLSEQQKRKHPFDIDAWIFESIAQCYLGNYLDASALANHVYMRISSDDTSEKAKITIEMLDSINTETCSKGQ